MCQSPDISLVRRTVELKYDGVRRSAALRGLLLNGALLGVLAYDLCVWCGAWCWAAGAEALGALVLLANCGAHLAALAALARRAPRAPRAAPAAPPAAPRAEPGDLSPPRSWRDEPAAPPAPPEPPAAAARADPHEFIADGAALAAYVRRAEERAGAAGGAGPRLLPAPPRAHQLALLPERGGDLEPAEDEGAAGGGPAMWRRLRLDPDRLTEYNLNLRLWLHVTVVGRVARELSAGEAAPASLQPFLAPFADRQYVAERVQELARGGCLSAYRWDGGGRGWRAGGERPCDAELLLHLFATYVELVAPGTRALAALRRTERWPPRWAVLAGGGGLRPAPGRHNLLQALLALLAAAAAREPPALGRLHLGPAGLNVLWVLGR